jgi:hypothetical protein
MHSATYRKELLKKRTRQTSLSGEKTFCTYRVNMRIAVDESVSRAASLVQTLRTGPTSTNGVLRREDIYFFLTRRNIWEMAFLSNGLLLAQKSVRPYCYFFTTKITIEYFFFTPIKYAPLERYIRFNFFFFLPRATYGFFYTGCDNAAKVSNQS